jgi:hypothetical protein
LRIEALSLKVDVLTQTIAQVSKNGQFLLSHSIKAGTRRIDGSEKSNVSDVTITEKGAPNFSDTDRIKGVSLDLKRPVLHSTGGFWGDDFNWLKKYYFKPDAYIPHDVKYV